MNQFSRTKTNLIYLFPVLMLCYFIYGAASGNLYIPGKSSSLSMSGFAAWTACLWPILWLIGEFIRHEPSIKLDRKVRKIAANVLLALGVISFFYAITLV